MTPPPKRSSIGSMQRLSRRDTLQAAPEIEPDAAPDAPDGQSHLERRDPASPARPAKAPRAETYAVRLPADIIDAWRARCEDSFVQQKDAVAALLLNALEQDPDEFMRMVHERTRQRRADPSS